MVLEHGGTEIGLTPTGDVDDFADKVDGAVEAVLRSKLNEKDVDFDAFKPRWAKGRWVFDMLPFKGELMGVSIDF